MKIIKTIKAVTKRIIAKAMRRRNRAKGQRVEPATYTEAMKLMSQFYHMGQPPVAAKAGQFRAANREGLQRIKTIRADKTRMANGHIPTESRQVRRRKEMARDQVLGRS